jgi:O-acetyl-ADP-ribose deacetylase (regulator of RNase III)
MKLILVDISREMCVAWREAFGDFSEVEVVQSDFRNLPTFDCMVSPANSFGLMDGGVDAVITRFFGEELMHRVQKRIIDEWRGEQPVGTSMIVETEHPRHPYLAHTPTMRVPMTIARTDNVYKAMWAMLLAVHHHNRAEDQKIEVIACPGLGTGVGHVPYRQAARQMALAYKNFLHPPRYIDWKYASDRQVAVRYGGDDGFNFPPEWI